MKIVPALMALFATVAVAVATVHGQDVRPTSVMFPPMRAAFEACERVVAPESPDVHAGVIICGRFEIPLPLTSEDLDQLAACLDVDSVVYDLRIISDQWKFFNVDELVVYPIQREIDATPVTVGFANLWRNEIYVRKVLWEWEWIRKTVWIHEVMHAVTGIVEHSPMFERCSKVK